MATILQMRGGDITILIADDHPIILAGLREILREDSSLHIVAECQDGESALERIRSLKPLVALLDLEMPKLSGLDVAAIVQRDELSTLLIMLTVTDRIEIFNRAMECGVVGYILKETTGKDLLDAIHTVLRGQYYFSPTLSARALVMRSYREGIPQAEDRLARLTLTERKVLHFIGEDRSSAEIAAMMNISIRTVDSHRANISEKLDVHGAYALVRFALQNKDQI